ncbi:MAG: DUF4364 family protein [Oscillospiraceae bacterium]|nr:DUF4364 family protein [Oscillospiraceae bacterium]
MKRPQKSEAVITDEAKIITLICFLLKNFSGLNESLLLEIVTVDELVSQFSLSDALTVIENKGLAHLSAKSASKEKAYVIKPAGEEWLSQFEGTLSAEVRRRLIKTGRQAIKLSDLKKTAKWGVVQENGQAWVFFVNFLNEIDGTCIMEIRIHSKSRDGAIIAQEKFLKNPVDILSNTIGNFIG